jgi:hypothetical protein
MAFCVCQCVSDKPDKCGEGEKEKKETKEMSQRSGTRTNRSSPPPELVVPQTDLPVGDQQLLIRMNRVTRRQAKSEKEETREAADTQKTGRNEEPETGRSIGGSFDRFIGPWREESGLKSGPRSAGR